MLVVILSARGGRNVDVVAESRVVVVGVSVLVAAVVVAGVVIVMLSVTSVGMSVGGPGLEAVVVVVEGANVVLIVDTGVDV